MITLNGERGFVSLDKWEDIFDIPGFKPKLDPKENELKEIIGRYIEKDLKPCGLSTCNQPHGKGYIVTTKSNFVTNIGNRCGKTHFGVEFEQASRVLERAIQDNTNRELIATFLFQIESHLDLIKTARHKEKGADWINKHINMFKLRGKGCPEVILAELSSMVKKRDNTIYVPRYASKQEIDDLEEIGGKKLPRPYIIDEPKGALNGFQALNKESNIKEILINDIEKNLNVLEEFDIDSATEKEVRFWSKWCSEFESKLKNVNQIVSDSKDFLQIENLTQLLVFLEKEDEKREYKKWLESNLA